LKVFLARLPLRARLLLVRNGEGSIAGFVGVLGQDHQAAAALDWRQK
jgi:hypothetical protein